MALIFNRLLALARRKPPIESRAWMAISLANLRHNVAQLRRVLHGGCALMAVVKGDAYGHGAVRISRELNGMGVDAFCVSTVKEGMTLRKAGVKGEILILGFTHPDAFNLLRRYRLTQTVLDYSYALVLNGFLKPLNVHVKIDTGMHRLGESAENMDRIADIFMCRNLRITGIYTHLSVSDSPHKDAVAATQKQIARFERVLQELARRGFKRPKTHIQSSYGLVNYPDLQCDYARVGIALYDALDPARLFSRDGLDLRPVLSLKARIGLLRNIPAGETIGYGLDTVAPRDMRLALLTIGYADGIPRRLSSVSAWATINGHKAPMIGPMSMDSLLVDVTELENISLYDTALIMGGPLPATLSATQIAALDGTIPPEFLSRLGKRLERRYDSTCFCQKTT